MILNVHEQRDYTDLIPNISPFLSVHLLACLSDKIAHAVVNLSATLMRTIVCKSDTCSFAKN